VLLSALLPACGRSEVQPPSPAPEQTAASVTLAPTVQPASNESPAPAAGEDPALLRAVRACDARRVDELIGGKADVNAAGENGETPLMAAVGCEGSTIAKALIDADAAVNAQDSLGRTALMGASEVGNLDMLRLLLESGADVAARTRHGATALHVAAYNGQAEAVLMLVEAVADPNAQDDE
jgi:ankyrin repeat protein